MKKTPRHSPAPRPMTRPGKTAGVVPVLAFALATLASSTAFLGMPQSAEAAGTRLYATQNTGTLRTGPYSPNKSYGVFDYGPRITVPAGETRYLHAQATTSSALSQDIQEHALKMMCRTPDGVDHLEGHIGSNITKSPAWDVSHVWMFVTAGATPKTCRVESWIIPHNSGDTDGDSVRVDKNGTFFEDVSGENWAGRVAQYTVPGTGMDGVIVNDTYSYKTPVFTARSAAAHVGAMVNAEASSCYANASNPKGQYECATQSARIIPGVTVSNWGLHLYINQIDGVSGEVCKHNPGEGITYRTINTARHHDQESKRLNSIPIDKTTCRAPYRFQAVSRNLARSDGNGLVVEDQYTSRVAVYSN